MSSATGNGARTQLVLADLVPADGAPLVSTPPGLTRTTFGDGEDRAADPGSHAIWPLLLFGSLDSY